MIATIDFETLDTMPTAVVLSVGLTAFDLDATNTWDELESNSIFWRFDATGQTKRTVSQSTQDWWYKQSEEAKKMAFDGVKWDVAQVLTDIGDWCERVGVTHLVGNGSDFDNVILANLCEMYDVPYPIPYYGNLDLRTMKYLACDTSRGKDFPEGKLQHYALHDAIHEAQCAQKYYKVIKGVDIKS